VRVVTPDGSGAAWGEWKPTREEAQMRGRTRNFVLSVVRGLDMVVSVDKSLFLAFYYFLLVFGSFKN
jgi:hypothetical protein